MGPGGGAPGGIGAFMPGAGLPWGRILCMTAASICGFITIYLILGIWGAGIFAIEGLGKLTVGSVGTGSLVPMA